jgi:hypothetical protein
MEGIIVEIADHPVTGHKRKVEVTGLGINFTNEVIGLETVCRYYENVGGAYGELVSTPQPIKISKTLIAETTGENVAFAKVDTGESVIHKYRDSQKEYWVLRSDETIEVPAENVTKMFLYLINILKTQSIVLEKIMIQFVVAEALVGSYDKVK